MSYHGYIKHFFCLPIPMISKHILSNYIFFWFVIFLKTFILVNCNESFQIPDQQAQIGKLFYYKIHIPSNDIKDIKINEADDNKLPDWLYFDKDKLEIVGIPLIKGLHFIELQFEKNDEKHLSDIFALDIIDVPILQNNQLNENLCLLQIKETFNKVSDVWKIISYLTPYYPPNQYNDQDLKHWLEKVEISKNNYLNHYSISIQEQICSPNVLDDEIHVRLTKLGLHNELVHISRNSLGENQYYNDMPLATNVFNEQSSSNKLNFHYRRHVDNIHRTPEVVPGWVSLTTSTIVPSVTDDSIHSPSDPLTRHIIPSMTSPTLDLPSSKLDINALGHNVINSNELVSSHKYFSTVIYTTPIPSPEIPTTLISQDGMLTPTPILPLSSTFTTTTLDQSETSIFIAPSPSLIPEATASFVQVVPESFDIDKTTQVTPSNKNPYINKRIRKLELIAGKYWRFTIPEDTFVDFEDGDTRKLKLTFLISSSSSSSGQAPASDYWIQFDHENQYLYALPIEDNVGKHVFNLVAVDSNGAHVTETLEIHVRQHKLTRAFTHLISLYDVKWDSSNFAFVIEAISTLLRKIATRIYGDGNIQTIALQKIVRNHQRDTWTITWTNDTLMTHPCPRSLIEELFAKLINSDKKIGESSAEPSRLLRQTIRPDFELERIELKYVQNSACGSYGTPPEEPDKKKSPIVRNRIGRLGPFKLGEAFRFKIPEDTFYSEGRDVSTRELSLTLKTIDPSILPDFISFDTYEQELYGLALSPEQVRTYELNLIAEDRVIGDVRANDIFTIEIIDESRELTDRLTFELFMNLLAPIGREEISNREKVDIVSKISSKMFNDGHSDAVRILGIRKFVFNSTATLIDEMTDNEIGDRKFMNKRSHRHKHEMLSLNRKTRNSHNHYYYEFRWTNRTIIDDGSCPREFININIIDRIFKESKFEKFKEIFEPNFELINIEFIPIGQCKNEIKQKQIGVRPIPATIPVITHTTTTTTTTTTEQDVNGNVITDEDPDFLFTTIIPPVAIFVALLLAIVVGCCFHRANRKRKSLEISRISGDPIHPEREAFLQKGRKPIIFEFEQQQQQQQQQYHSNPSNTLINPVIMPPGQQQQPQQMTPLRQLGKPTYQPLTEQGLQMRRQPPPYYK